MLAGSQYVTYVSVVFFKRALRAFSAFCPKRSNITFKISIWLPFHLKLIVVTLYDIISMGMSSTFEVQALTDDVLDPITVNI